MPSCRLELRQASVVALELASSLWILGLPRLGSSWAKESDAVYF